jgi:hypothetical protein
MSVYLPFVTEFLYNTHWETAMFLNMTIAEAEQIAAAHENEENWDFWTFISQRTYEQALQTCNEEQMRTIEHCTITEDCHE